MSKKICSDSNFTNRQSKYLRFKINEWTLVRDSHHNKALLQEFCTIVAVFQYFFSGIFCYLVFSYLYIKCKKCVRKRAEEKKECRIILQRWSGSIILL